MYQLFVLPTVPGESAQKVYPAAMKHAFRYHIRKLCMSPHCVDSLVIYMNSPARNDGTSYLWDVDRDGIVSKVVKKQRNKHPMILIQKTVKIPKKKIETMV